MQKVQRAITVWVDADACPVPIRDIILRAAKKRSIRTIFVANKPIALPESESIGFVLVQNGPDEADAYIAENASAGDLVVTQDIPLAAQLVPRGATVISPRGDSFNAQNISDRLSTRDLLYELRSIGEITGGPAPFDDKLKRKFASLFDAALYKLSL
ncbi:MAG: YaiI/YqxD family protein [Terriglobales bacterium]